MTHRRGHGGKASDGAEGGGGGGRGADGRRAGRHDTLAGEAQHEDAWSVQSIAYLTWLCHGLPGLLSIQANLRPCSTQALSQCAP
jgi:hypothetical protein